MRLLVLLASVLLSMAACNTVADNPNVTSEEKQDEVTLLKKEVIAIHDTAMEKMGTVSQLMKRLHDQWQASPDSLPYQQSFRQLRQAKDDMMDWMRNFESPDEMDEEEAKTYLLREKKSIQAINSQMDKAINEARHLIEVTTSTDTGDTD